MIYIFCNRVKIVHSAPPPEAIWKASKCNHDIIEPQNHHDWECGGQAAKFDVERIARQGIYTRTLKL